MRNRKINRMNKEKIAMIASSLLIVTACTLTGVYINGKEKAKEKENVVDFTKLEGKKEITSEKSKDIISTETVPLEEQALNDKLMEQDLDVDPVYQETGSSSIINPEFMSQPNGEEEKEDQEKDEDLEEDNQKVVENADSDEEKQETENEPASETMKESLPTFGETENLSWPVQGEILMNYSMDKTVYFATLNQYKYNPAILIKTEPETEVKAPYAGTIKEIGDNAEIGKYVVMDLGNGYELTIGQLQNLTIKQGDKITKEQTIGKAALPSKYYSMEGTNIYLKMTKDGDSVNPMNFLNS